MNKSYFFRVVFILLLIASYFRFSNLKYDDMTPDVGYELEAARIINQEKKLPLIGPAIGVEDLFIPPTYLYLISFFYFLTKGDVLFITAFYSVMGLLTVVFLSILIYLITNNKKITLLSLASFSFWSYLVSMSRSIWHPYPVFFFLSLSFVCGALALKNKATIYLFVSQWLFFIALSIYPSPIFFLPILIANTSYFFKIKGTNSSKKVFFYSLVSIFFFAVIVYFPQLIFEFQNNFISINSLLNNQSEIVTSINAIFTHYLNLFQVFFNLFFQTESYFYQLLFFLFILLLMIFPQFQKNKQTSPLIKIFTSKFLLIWIIFISYFLIKLEIPYVYHRIDVLALFFFILLAINLNLIKKFVYVFPKNISVYLILLFYSLFLIINFYYSFKKSEEKNFYSYFANSRIGSFISFEIQSRNFNRSRVMIFYNFGDWQNKRGDPLMYFWIGKWQAEPIDHFVNQKFITENPLTSNLQHTLNYGFYDIDYLNADYYFLICNDYYKNNHCLDYFLTNLRDLDSNNLHLFSKEDGFIFDYNFFTTQIFLIKNIKV